MCYVNSCPLKLPRTSKCPFVFDSVLCFLNVCICFSTELQSIPSLELFHVAFLQSFYWLTVLSVVAMATWYSVFSLCALHTVIRCHPQSAVPLLCPQPCEAHRSMGLLKFEASPLFISKTFNLSCFHSVGIRPWQPVWLIEKEASATSGVEMWQRQEAADGRLWLLPTGSAAVESDFKGTHLLSVACFLDGCVKYVPRIY